MSRDGTTPNTMSADLDMNTHLILNLDQATQAGHAVEYTQLQDRVDEMQTLHDETETFKNQASSYADDAFQSKANAATSEANAAASATAANGSALAAASSAASVDIPTSLIGQSLKVLRVKADESTYEFAANGVTAYADAIHAATSKSTPVDADELGLVDSAASNTLKRLTWANLKAALKSAFAWREVLTASRTYYVRTDGSDSNTGLANTSGGAFLTIQKAIDVVGSLDLSIYNVTIQVGAGTYVQSLVLKSLVGAGLVTIIGDATTPANVVVSPASGACFSANSITGRWAVSGFKTITAGGAIQILVQNSALELGVMDYGDAAGSGIHIYVGRGANVYMSFSTQTISATTFGYHYYLDNNGVFYGGTRTTTLTGNPTFVTYARVTGGANLRNGSETFSGSVASGKKYDVTGNASLDSGGSTFPGPTAGTTSTGGQYI